MVVDIKKLSDALRSSSPKEDLRRDLERIIGAHRQQIHEALAAGQSYVLRVPDGRRIRISPKSAPVSTEPATAR
jgi:NAD(P)H-flavin reductase